MSARVLTRLSLPLVFILAAACGGGDDEPLQPLSPPPVSPSLTVLGQGSLDLNVGANATQGLDPSSLAAAAGATMPCGKLVFLFSWRTEGKKSLEFTSRVQQGEVKVGEGSEGVASVPGCGVIGAKNGGGSAVIGELRYVIAETR